MATPEQDAFIQEMRRKKPGEIWQELWDARQRLKEVDAVETPSSFIHKQPVLDLKDISDLMDLTSDEARARGYIRPVKMQEVGRHRK